MTEVLYKILTELKLLNRLKAIEILQKQNGGLAKDDDDFLLEVRKGEMKDEA